MDRIAFAKTESIFWIVAIAGMLAGCTGMSKSKLAGDWQAVQMIEDGKLSEIDIRSVKLSFHKNGRYAYFGNLKTTEAGTFRLAPPILYSTDTTTASRVEKAVEILLLSSDSLILKMEHEQRERILKMVRAD